MYLLLKLTVNKLQFSIEKQYLQWDLNFQLYLDCQRKDTQLSDTLVLRERYGQRHTRM